jgi:hypothetical protein
MDTSGGIEQSEQPCVSVRRGVGGRTGLAQVLPIPVEPGADRDVEPGEQWLGMIAGGELQESAAGREGDDDQIVEPLAP